MTKYENFFLGQLKKYIDNYSGGKKIYHDPSRKLTGYEYFTSSDLALKYLPKLMAKLND